MARHMGGWVKIYRALVNGDIGNNPYRFTLFSKLIGWANLKETWVEWNGKPRKCPRGSLVTSLKELADSMECSKDTVNRQLLYLQLRQSVVFEKSSHGLFVTIPNYEEYQSQDASGLTETEREPDSSSTHAEREPEHNEERKNKRNKEIKNTYAFLENFNSLSKKYRDLFPGTVTGGNALARFKDQFQTEASIGQLEMAIGHYADLLKTNDWRNPKQSFETFLGTKRSGLFWKQFIERPNLTVGSKSDFDFLYEGKERPA